ncbi:MAG: hypothetical protein ACYCX4_17660, partial [Bacillota bacterium]
DNASWTSWATYSPYQSYTLSGPDGTKSVYVQVKDASGNVGTGYDQIALQTTNTAPINGATGNKFVSTSGNSGTAVVGGQTINVKYTQGTGVSLNLDPALNPSYVQYSMDNLRWLPAESYVSSKVFTLPDYEGFKTIFVRLPDGTTYSQTFVVDRTPPKIDEAVWKNGASATTSTTAYMEITATDNYTPDTELQVSTNKTTWSAFNGEVAVTLSSTPGYQTVTVYIKDDAGNITKVTKSIWKL